MKSTRNPRLQRPGLALAAALLLLFSFSSRLFAHCDTMNGPIIPEAQAALAAGDVTPILKWVKPEGEAEIRTAFAQAVAVRKFSPEAAALADRYFLETLIRVHRAGEGAPYTGLKDEPAEPVVVMADNTITQGSADDMIAKINAHLGAVIQEKYDALMKAKADKDKSVEAGRKYVAAYVDYMHYVENVHAAIVAEVGHHHESAAGSHSGE